MASIVLRVSGERLDIDECLSLLPQLRAEDCYRPGESARNRPPRTESGFVLTLADDDDDLAAIELTQRRLTSIAAPLRELLRDATVAEIDCGIFVTANAPQSLAFAPSFLESVTAARIRLRVTAYPCSDDKA
jgi:hypothetical protein